ncbi:4'-phosphopantetheinyl transferase superfamily protein [Cryobacterium melibiosiphilum]|uniref:4'-phosphopantetheinyl transferase superfamily protein n=2 Tax=Cryobacterium melibiosiphilum TaxID=995039 RepID=A0A3A5MS80_9MICO|nr:4'-phosphopantetheinyl transferase superfamily protein [Cryobacterium melibiosiphilum]
MFRPFEDAPHGAATTVVASSGFSMVMPVELVVARTDLIDAATFLRLRAGLPADRRERCDAYYVEHDRHASALTFALLQWLWQERHGAGPMPHVERAANGKPRFVGAAGFEFNLSHDARACVCAVASVPIGVDVQSRVSFDDALFERIAAPAELALRERFRRLGDLAWLWSRKEAVVKQSGVGLRAPLQSIDALTESGLVSFAVDGIDAVISVSVDGAVNDGFLGCCRVRLIEPIKPVNEMMSSVVWRERVLLPVPLQAAGL